MKKRDVGKRVNTPPHPHPSAVHATRSRALVATLFFLLGAATAEAQSIDLADASASAGQTVEVPLFWSENGSRANGLTVDIRGRDRNFDDEKGHPNCHFSPALLHLKEASATAYRPPRCTVGDTCTSIRIAVISFTEANNPLPVPSGEILRCSFTIPRDAPVGKEFGFVVEAASYILPDGSEFDITGASSGGIVRVATASQPQAQAVTHKGSDGCASVTHGNAGSRGSFLGLLPLLVLVVLRRREGGRLRRPLSRAR